MPYCGSKHTYAGLLDGSCMHSVCTLYTLMQARVMDYVTPKFTSVVSTRLNRK